MFCRTLLLLTVFRTVRTLAVTTEARSEDVAEVVREANIGDAVTLPCGKSMTNGKADGPDWKFYGPQLWTNETLLCSAGFVMNGHRCRYTISSDNELGVYGLTIHDVMATDAGFYVCHEEGGMENKHIVMLNITATTRRIVKQSRVLPAGCDVRLSCQPTSGRQTVWRRRIHSDDEIEVIDVEQNGERIRQAGDDIILKLVALDDNGQYTCHYRRNGKVVRRIDLFVAGSLNESMTQLKLVSAAAGETVILTAPAKSGHKGLWLRQHLPNVDATVISENSKYQFRRSSKHSYELMINDIKLDDSGIYGCSEYQRIGSSQPVAYTLVSVRMKQQLHVYQQYVSARPGDTVIISARTTHGSEPDWYRRTANGDVVIYKDGTLSNERYDVITTRPGQCDLVIKNVTEDDAGYYRCVDEASGEEYMGNVSVHHDSQKIAENKPTTPTDGKSTRQFESETAGDVSRPTAMAHVSANGQNAFESTAIIWKNMSADLHPGNGQKTFQSSTITWKDLLAIAVIIPLVVGVIILTIVVVILRRRKKTRILLEGSTKEHGKSDDNVINQQERVPEESRKLTDIVILLGGDGAPSNIYDPLPCMAVLANEKPDNNGNSLQQPEERHRLIGGTLVPDDRAPSAEADCSYEAYRCLVDKK